MEKINFKISVLTFLSLITLILLFEIRLANAEIVFRSVKPDMFSGNSEKSFEYDICYEGKTSVFVDMQEEPLHVIPNYQIAKMSLAYKTCVDTSDVELKIDLKEGVRDQFKEFTSKFIDKRVALFLNGDIVSASTIIMPLERSIAFGCLSYEKAVAIIINNGFTPNYEETCVGGKTKMIDLTKKYKFKEDYAHRENFYQPVVNSSEFWYLKEETSIYDNPGGNIIAQVLAKKVIEQYYNHGSKEFEKKVDWLKVIYHGATGWIKRNHLAIPLFSLLDTNLFLQKFFPFSEYRYDEFTENKKVYSDYLVKRASSVRQLYIKEAINRFKNDNEFKRWYFDTFGKEFKVENSDR